MGEIVRFISKAERERVHLIREARALYDSVFPPVNPVGAEQNRASGIHLIGGANSSCNDGIGPS